MEQPRKEPTLFGLALWQRENTFFKLSAMLSLPFPLYFQQAASLSFGF
jgi:hypothetical protein